jgi:hypothetical protein
MDEMANEMRGRMNPSAVQEPSRPANVPENAKKAGDGHWYSPDPNRPGKYLRWD